MSEDSGAGATPAPVSAGESAPAVPGEPKAGVLAQTIMAGEHAHTCGPCFEAAVALYAIDRFAELADDSGEITKESLFNLLRSPAGAPEFRSVASFLYRELASVGHNAGTRETTQWYAAGHAAMPVTFTSTVYSISREDLKRLSGVLGT